MPTPVPIWVYDITGAPLPSATPSIHKYVSKAGAARPHPSDGVVHVHEEAFRLTPSDEDETTGTVAIIDCGPGAWPPYQVLEICRSANQFATFVPFDEYGALASGAPTLGAYVEIETSVEIPAPGIVKAGAEEIYTVTPPAADVTAGVSLRLDSPSGLQPPSRNWIFTNPGAPAVVPAPATLGSVVVAQLAADATVAALLGTKMFPNFAPQGATAPFLVYRVVSAVPVNLLHRAPSLESTRFQIDSYGKRYETAHEVAEAVDAVLRSLPTPRVLSSWRLGSRDLYDNEAQLHRVSADYSIWRPV